MLASYPMHPELPCRISKIEAAGLVAFMDESFGASLDNSDTNMIGIISNMVVIYAIGVVKDKSRHVAAAVHMGGGMPKSLGSWGCPVFQR